MKLIWLTSFDTSERFCLQAELIERIQPSKRGGSEIKLTTGNWVACIENPSRVKAIVEESNEQNHD